MEDRLRKVEDAVVRIEATLPHLATKADVAELRTTMAESVATMVKWFVGTAFAMVGLASAISFGVARVL